MLVGTSTWRELGRSDGFRLKAEMTARVLPSEHRLYWGADRVPRWRALQWKKIRWTDGVRALWILFRTWLGS